MDPYVIIAKLHDDVWFCSIFKHVKLMNFTPSMVGLAWHQPKAILYSLNALLLSAVNWPILVCHLCNGWNRENKKTKDIEYQGGDREREKERKREREKEVEKERERREEREREREEREKERKREREREPHTQTDVMT